MPGPKVGSMKRDQNPDRPEVPTGTSGPTRTAWAARATADPPWIGEPDSLHHRCRLLRGLSEILPLLCCMHLHGLIRHRRVFAHLIEIRIVLGEDDHQLLLRDAVKDDPDSFLHRDRIRRDVSLKYRGRDVSRAYYGKYDVLRLVFVAERAGQRDDRALRGGIDRLVRGAEECGKRRRIDDLAAALLLHDSERRVHPVDHSPEIGIDHILPYLKGGSLVREALAYPCVVEHIVQAAELRDAVVDHLLHGGIVPHVDNGIPGVRVP